MRLALIIGYTFGVILAFLASKYFLRAAARRLFDREEQQRWVKWTGGLFAAISFAPGIFTSMMAGGVIGGDADSAIASTLGMPVPVILSSRIALVTVVVVTLNAAVGAGFGYLVAKGVFPARPSA
jgi:uncharacterized membrane protein YdjX (TVP38/TMEM64 family)